jgi:hypothetical protein
MKTASAWPAALRSVLMQPAHGVVGLVDDLLALCAEHGLELDWRAERLRVRSDTADWQELNDVPLRTSVFRAILARVAALCNEQSPGACSPYGGQAEISVGAEPASILRVVFTNTPGEQQLALTQDHAAKPSLGRDGNPVLAALLHDVPHLRKNHQGWADRSLVPALMAFHDDASDAEVASALSSVRKLLLARADTDPRLRDIANLGTREYAGNPMAMPWASQLGPHVELRHEPGVNRTVVLQARRLVAELTAAVQKKADRAASPPSTKPDGKS